MRQLVSGTAVQVTSFVFMRPDAENNLWWYTVNRSSCGGTWSIIRRKQENAPIPPYMQILCYESDEAPVRGCFNPVVGNEAKPLRFPFAEHAVAYIEENY